MNFPELTVDFKDTCNMLFIAHMPQILGTAVDLRLFDALAAEPMGTEHLARELGTDSDMTLSLLEILREGGYLAERAGDYSLNPVAREFFVSSSPAFQGRVLTAMANMSGLLGNAREIMTQGGPAHDDKLWANEEMMETMLQGGRGGKIQSAAAFIASLPEFSSMRRMCDIAGSFGYFSMGILDRHPEMSAVVCDLPEVAEAAGSYIEKAGYEGRLEARGVDLASGGDFGEGYDLVFVSNYLYEWSLDHRLVDFLKRVRSALTPGGVFVSRHMTLDVRGEDLKSQLIMEYMTRLGGYPTHAISEARLTEALTEAGFCDFTVRKPEDGSYDNTLDIAARVAP
ncbi:methyltransferase [Desulfoluna spongiiphila]|uniref:Dimerisation domain-containing protein n=1 Tax=Desulfoluna spongiiphila TaxID=419481 RepID=A0A1G5H9E3_9BACT|nr:methyltransferase [Desulfoluna spongiiphila]SCY60406.1 Dimerisation domain-containing protein [Desulfoluna spongiiphila]